MCQICSTDSNQAPIAQVDDRHMAKEFVARYDQALSDPSLATGIHRVSHYICSTDMENCLGHAMRAYANGAPMTLGLRTEITAYQLCVLDDGIAQSPHACVGYIVKQSSHSSVPWWSATVRLDQNIESRERMQALAKGRFTAMFQAWKAVGQRNHHRYRRLTPQRVNTTHFLQFVYRTGEYCRVDWSYLALGAPPSVPNMTMQSSITSLQEVKVDYIRRVCLPGQAFTVPRLTAIDSIEMLSSSGGKVVYSDRPICFQVVTNDVTKKRHVQTQAMSNIRRMVCPMTVQHFAIWNCTHWPCSELDVYPDGLPDVVDLACLTDWHALLNGMQRWNMHSISDVEGCWQWTASDKICDLTWSVPPMPPHICVMCSCLHEGSTVCSEFRACGS